LLYKIGILLAKDNAYIGTHQKQNKLSGSFAPLRREPKKRGYEEVVATEKGTAYGYIVVSVG
jgi:hypothetical protein